MKQSIGRLAVAVPLAFLALTGLPRDARANDPATATVLFNEARHLISTGKYEGACPKLEESQRLDPGIGTLFNLADCYEHVGRTASAWAVFLDVMAQAKFAGSAAREQVARDRAAALEAKLSKLTIIAPKDVMGLEVRRNGEILGGVLWGNAIPVDPAGYTIEASAPGKKKWSTVATVGPNGAAVTVVVPALESEVHAVAADATPEASRDAQATDPPPPGFGNAKVSERTSTGSSRRTIALVLAGVGVVGVGIGSAMGLKSISSGKDASPHCHGNECDATGVGLRQDALSAGTGSTIAFAAGLSALAGGAVLWLTAPAPSLQTGRIQAAPLVGYGTGGLLVRGAW